MAMLQEDYHQELKKELEGTTQHTHTTPKESKKKKKNVDDEETEDDDQNLQQFADDNDNMSKVAMSRKKRRLYEAMKVSFYCIYLILFFISRSP